MVAHETCSFLVWGQFPLRDYSIWNLYTPCGSSTVSTLQREDDFQMYWHIEQFHLEVTHLLCNILSQWDVVYHVNKKIHWFWPKLRPSITGPWWIARSAITRGRGVFNVHEHCVSCDAPVRKQNLRAWRTPRDDFGFLDWNIYFRKGCNYSNKVNEMML